MSCERSLLDDIYLGGCDIKNSYNGKLDDLLNKNDLTVSYLWGEEDRENQNITTKFIDITGFIVRNKIGEDIIRIVGGYKETTDENVYNHIRQYLRDQKLKEIGI